MAKQKMIAKEGEQMISADEVKAAAKKAKVNMTLPSGTQLVQGEEVTLTEDDEAHFAKHFPDNLHLILG